MARPQRPARREAGVDTRTPARRQAPAAPARPARKAAAPAPLTEEQRRERAKRVADRIRANRKAAAAKESKRTVRASSDELLEAVAEAVRVESKATGQHPQDILISVARKVAATMPKDAPKPKKADSTPQSAADGDVKETDVTNIDSNPLSEEEVRKPDAETTVEGDPHGGISEEVLNKGVEQVDVEAIEHNHEPDAGTIDQVSDIEQIDHAKETPGFGGTSTVSNRADRLFDVFAFVERREELGLSKKATRLAEIARFERMSDEQLEAYKQATDEFAQAPARRSARRVVRTVSAEGGAPERFPALGQASFAHTASTEDADGDDYLAFL